MRLFRMYMFIRQMHRCGQLTTLIMQLNFEPGVSGLPGLPEL